MAKEKIMKQAEENLNEKTDISTPLSEFVRKFKKQKTAIVALVFILFLVVLSFTAKFIAPYGINDFDYNAIMQAPTAAHWFGTDEFGRDLFSRIICGTGISLSVGLFSVSIAAVIGSFLGLIGGYYGGIIDSIIMRICDALFAFPGIILAIAIVAILGSGTVRNLRVWYEATPWQPRTACSYRQQRTSARMISVSCSTTSCRARSRTSSCSTVCPSDLPF